MSKSEQTANRQLAEMARKSPYSKHFQGRDQRLSGGDPYNSMRGAVVRQVRP